MREQSDAPEARAYALHWGTERAGCAARRDLSKHEEEGEGERKRGGVGDREGRRKGEWEGRKEGREEARRKRHTRALQTCTPT
jgi:hypothetical protein